MFQGQTASLGQGCGILPGALLQKLQEELPANYFTGGVGLKDLSKIIHDAVFTACSF